MGMKKGISLFLIAAVAFTGCAGEVNESIADNSQSEDNQLQIIFTIDAEDGIGDVPNKFECNFGEEGNCCVHYIMDTFEKYGMKAVFL